MEWLVKCRKGRFLTLVTSQLVYHYLYRPQALMKAPPEAKAEGKARLRAKPCSVSFLLVLKQRNKQACGISKDKSASPLPRVPAQNHRSGLLMCDGWP